MLVESIKAQLSNLTAMYSDKCLIIQLKKKKQNNKQLNNFESCLY